VNERKTETKRERERETENGGQRQLYKSACNLQVGEDGEMEILGIGRGVKNVERERSGSTK
jgi:hypothetical protein